MFVWSEHRVQHGRNYTWWPQTLAMEPHQLRLHTLKISSDSEQRLLPGGLTIDVSADPPAPVHRLQPHSCSDCTPCTSVNPPAYFLFCPSSPDPPEGLQLCDASDFQINPNQNPDLAVSRPIQL